MTTKTELRYTSNLLGVMLLLDLNSSGTYLRAAQKLGSKDIWLVFR